MARVLLIDDCDDFRACIDEMLRRLGHEVVSTDQAAEGIGMFDCGGFDAVVTDILMPGVDGLETILALRRQCRHTPILAVTGDTEGGWLDRAMQAFGATAVLRKPIEAKDLASVLDLQLAAPRAQRS